MAPASCAALALTLALVGAPLSQAGEGAAEDAVLYELRYADGNGNVTRIWREHGETPLRFCYSPVTPERSSSGLYSGGEPRHGPVGAELERRLETGLRQLATDPPDGTDPKRPKGSAAFTILREDHEERFTRLPGAALTAFDSLMQELRASGATGPCGAATSPSDRRSSLPLAGHNPRTPRS